MRADSGRRAGPQAGCGGWGQSGATRRRDRSPPAGRPAGVHVDAVDVVGADGYGPLWGLPHIEAVHRAAITTATPRRRAGSWCVNGSSASVGWTRRPSVGARNREVRGACRPRPPRPSRPGTTSRSRSEKPDGLLAGLVIGTEPRSRHSRTPRTRRSHSATRGRRVWGRYGALWKTKSRLLSHTGR